MVFVFSQKLEVVPRYVIRRIEEKIPIDITVVLRDDGLVDQTMAEVAVESQDVTQPTEAPDSYAPYQVKRGGTRAGLVAVAASSDVRQQSAVDSTKFAHDLLI